MEKLPFNYFFLSERRLNKSDANKLCYIAEKCFDEVNIMLGVLGWCGNYQMNLKS